MAFTVLNAPVRLTVSTRCHSSSSISSRRAERPMPAALTRMSMPPKAATAASTAARTAAIEPTSHTALSATPPARRIVSTVAATPAPFTSTPKTFAPSAAKSRAVARPRPEPAPVMKSTRPANLIVPTPPARGPR